MLINFFLTLKKYQVRTTMRELLDLLNALKHEVVFSDINAFYYLSRTVMVKDELQYDKFDRAFADYFKGIQAIDIFDQSIPNEWLRKELEKRLSPEEKAELKAMGGLDKLMETLQERLNEQEKRHQGGNKWNGTGGTSPFGAYGDNPEGVRIGQDGNRNFSAVKVWDERTFKNFSDDESLSSRNIQMALRKLHRFARTGAAAVLDIHDTIGSTAKNAGLLDIKMALSGIMQSKSWCFLMWVVRWMLMCVRSKSYLVQCIVSSNILNIFIFIIVCMKAYGKTMPVGHKRSV